ncbi:MAG TPA: hypothetical protein PLW65_12720 [Pseudomonadota bacterium]|nr:hypothetical protein [Pseudomonadota bacterium]
MSERFTIGAHTLIIDEYRLEQQLRGDFLLEHAVEMLGLMEQVLAKHGFAVTYVRVLEPGRHPGDARHYTAQWYKRLIPRGASAIVGATPAMRLITSLLIRAVNLLYKQNNQIAFFEQEAEARAWLEEQVIRLRATPAT